MLTKFVLFMSVLARDNPVDGGGSVRDLKSTTMVEALAEAKAIVAERDDGCDFTVDFYAVAEVVAVESIILVG